MTEGQNYDRMETDLESDGSSSEEGAPELPEGVVDSSLMEVEPPEDGEIMDTRPDSVTPESPSIIGEQTSLSTCWLVHTSIDES